MILGVPREIKEGELRVALTPDGVLDFTDRGHTVLVEKGAGVGCHFPDGDYEKAGGRIVGTAEEVWESAQLLLKVKEPLPEEYAFFREELTLFTFLHLAADPRLLEELLATGITAIAYETVRLENGFLPLLSPMSEVAGCISVQKGADCLEAQKGGRGVLLPGISGAPPARVTVIGGGIVGSNACRVATGMGAQVTVLDLSIARLEHLREVFGERVVTLFNNEGVLQECLAESDMVIGAVLLPGKQAPRIIKRSMLDNMQAGSVLVDVSIDQGGLAETSRPTTHRDPSYVVSRVVHCCIANLPAAVPRSATQALTSCTIPYILSLADKGVDKAMEEDPSLCEGMNTCDGKITHPALEEILPEKP